MQYSVCADYLIAPFVSHALAGADFGGRHSRCDKFLIVLVCQPLPQLLVARDQRLSEGRGLRQDFLIVYIFVNAPAEDDTGRVG